MTDDAPASRRCNDLAPGTCVNRSRDVSSDLSKSAIAYRRSRGGRGKLTNTGLRLRNRIRSMTAALIVNGNQSIGKKYRAWKNLVQDWNCCHRSTWRLSLSPNPVVKLFSRTFSFCSTKVSFISHGIYVVRIASCTSSSFDYVELPSSSQDPNLIHVLPVIKIVSSPIFWWGLWCFVHTDTSMLRGRSRGEMQSEETCHSRTSPVVISLLLSSIPFLTRRLVFGFT